MPRRPLAEGNRAATRRVNILKHRGSGSVRPRMLASKSSAATTFAALAVAWILAACGNAPAGGGSQPPSAPASPPPRSLAVTVHLAAAFSPSSLRLQVGQQFLLVVNTNVRISGLPGPGSCAQGSTQQPVAGGLLSARCTARGYRYTALHAGHGELSAIVRPRCAPETACPQWITAPVLKITIS